MARSAVVREEAATTGESGWGGRGVVITPFLDDLGQGGHGGVLVEIDHAEVDL